MSKIIRTVRLGDDVVTLGAAERELFEQTEGQSLDSVGLTTLIDDQVAQVRKELEAEWEMKMRQEMKYLQAEADKRMAEAETRFAEERAQVYEERFQEGYQTGLDERESEATEAVRRMEILHGNLVAERAQILMEAEETVIDLAAALAHRIVGFQAEASPKVLVQVVRSALNHLSDSSNLEIRVHPDDLQIARRFATHWVQKVDQDAVLKVRSSDHVARGGCMIEGREENVDARLEEQVQVLHDGLRAAFFAHHEENEENRQITHESDVVAADESDVVVADESEDISPDEKENE